MRMYVCKKKYRVVNYNVYIHYPFFGKLLAIIAIGIKIMDMLAVDSTCMGCHIAPLSCTYQYSIMKYINVTTPYIFGSTFMFNAVVVLYGSQLYIS